MLGYIKLVLINMESIRIVDMATLIRHLSWTFSLDTGVNVFVVYCLPITNLSLFFFLSIPLSLSFSLSPYISLFEADS